MLVHDVFHVCYLKGYQNDHRNAPPPVPELDVEGEQDWEVHAVLDHKEFKQGRKHKLKYLLRFTGYGPEEDRWTDDVLTAKKVYKTTGTRSLWQTVHMWLSVLPSEEHAPDAIYTILLNTHIHSK